MPMKLRLLFWLSIVLAAGLVTSSSSQAQTAKPTAGSTKDRPSHIPLPSLPGSPELSLDDFRNQLEMMGDQANLEELLKNAAKDPEKFGLDDNLKGQLKDLQGKDGKPPKADLNDPNTQKLLKKLAEQYATESKAGDNALDYLTGGEDGPEWLKNQNEMEDDFDWGQFGQKVGFNKLEAWLPKMDGDWMNPKMPSVSGPNLEIKSAPAIPTFAGVSEGRGGVGAAIILGLILAAVLAFFAWKLRGWFMESDTDTLLGRWRLGPWPVQPALVRTREELVRAFEYLSLLRLGKAARNWNHRQIGDRLGGEKSAHTESGEAAARLATVYEHARYAPSADELPDRELETARRGPCPLRGVAGARNFRCGFHS